MQAAADGQQERAQNKQLACEEQQLTQTLPGAWEFGAGESGPSCATILLVPQLL